MGLQFTMNTKPDTTLPDSVIYRAQLKDLQLREFSWTDRKTNQPRTGSSLEWTWEITGPADYAGRTVRGKCDPDLNDGVERRDRFRPWAQALLGREIPKGAVLDTDDLVGLSADITVWHRPDKADPAKKWAEVDEVMEIANGGGFSEEPPF